MHAGTEVTLNDAGHLVTQVYCSAMPIAYSREGADDWEPIAKLVLEGAYEATLRVAAENLARTGNNKVFLTLLGGGAFGNEPEWIADAVLRAPALVRHSGLDIQLVSYGRSSRIAQDIIARWNSAGT